MIQTYLAERLEKVVPFLRWGDSYRTSDDGVGTVYYEGGGSPDEYDVPNRYPRYMVYLTSSDWGGVEYAAELVYKELHTAGGVDVTIEFTKDDVVVASKVVRVSFIKAAGEPQDLGVQNNIRAFSVNFDVLLTEYE